MTDRRTPYYYICTRSQPLRLRHKKQVNLLCHRISMFIHIEYLVLIHVYSTCRLVKTYGGGVGDGLIQVYLIFLKGKQCL